jgi:hypothetical protein
MSISDGQASFGDGAAEGVLEPDLVDHVVAGRPQRPVTGQQQKRRWRCTRKNGTARFSARKFSGFPDLQHQLGRGRLRRSHQSRRLQKTQTEAPQPQPVPTASPNFPPRGQVRNLHPLGLHHKPWTTTTATRFQASVLAPLQGSRKRLVHLHFDRSSSLYTKSTPATLIQCTRRDHDAHHDAKCGTAGVLYRVIELAALLEICAGRLD